MSGILFRQPVSAALIAATAALALVGCEAWRAVDNSLRLDVTGGGALTPGESQTATLDSLTEAHDWTFEGQAGQHIAVMVEGDDWVDPRITLLSPAGEILAATNENDGPDEILSYALPADGAYIIRVDVFRVGTYTITLIIS
jgi:hypothetical protein